MDASEFPRGVGAPSLDLGASSLGGHFTAQHVNDHIGKVSDECASINSYALPHSPKRRRLDPELTSPPAIINPSLPPRATAYASTNTPASPPRAPSRFLMQPGFTTSTTSTYAPPEPLPEAFSPHRRGTKFTPGGMAATVQHWVLEAGQTAAHVRRTSTYYARPSEDFAARIRIVEVRGRGPFMVRGVSVPDRGGGGNGEDVRVMLAGQWADGVEVGKIVGVRAPVWDVKAEVGGGDGEDSDDRGGMWMVGVDWKVLV